MSFFIVPKYTATEKIYVGSASQDSVVDLQLSSKLALDYQEMILIRPLLEILIDTLQLTNTTVKDFRESITVENPDDTRILNISVCEPSANLAADIANDVAKAEVTFLPEIMESGTPSIAEEAVVPSIPSSPHIVRYTIIDGIVPGLLLYFILVARFFADDTLRTSESMERYLGYYPLTTIPLDKDYMKSDQCNKRKEARR